MPERTVLRKDQLEVSLVNEKKLIKEGAIKDDNPLDESEPFRELCSACRKGDLKVCQEKITEGVNVNARDLYDYTPLILYDYSKSTDPLQPLAGHITSLLTRDTPVTTDIVVTASDESFHLHKFILAARSPYFHGKLAAAPESTTWKLPGNIAPDSFNAAIRYLYLGEPPRELRSGPGTGFTESEVFGAIDKISKHLEIQSLMDSILDSGDRRLARQRRTTELAKGREQMEEWYRANVLGNKIVLETTQANDVKWDRNNAIFADVLLQADELSNEAEDDEVQISTLFPCHRAMLLRSEFFQTMFSSSFREAQVTEHLQIIDVDCSPDVLEIILTFLYTERADFPLEIAVDVLFAADMLFIEKLKTKAAVVISTLGSSGMSQAEAAKTRGKDEDDIDIYGIMRAAWLTRVQRLEEFAARFLAYRLEAHIDTSEFAELIRESAERIQARQEVDSIELIDDIRFYLNERFRLRFNDAGLDEMMDDQAKPEDPEAPESPEEVSDITHGVEELDVSKPVHAAEKTREAADSIHGIRALDGGMVEDEFDEFDEDTMNYEILMEKLELLLESLNLEA
ncbi:hypothetical protein N7478_010907 [Penicillium angulare]|uniref:uncharacterized protein n=1 Tax=Penicillium angulare TaxID=116970 RepID=UPI002541D589|nr:uncharacterized protein N7478_010907 [Penicillium angulare]KAJ5263302.1 hypothetical protein N7478_010907 [Penicillium angulare]